MSQSIIRLSNMHTIEITKPGSTKAFMLWCRINIDYMSSMKVDIEHFSSFMTVYFITMTVFMTQRSGSCVDALQKKEYPY